jgi:hypothetical protein
MDELPRLEIKLDPNGVSAPAQRVVIIASQVVGTALRALDSDDLAIPEMQGHQFGFKFGGLEMSVDERRQTYSNWILSKGFQDLARGVRETLEEAKLYLDLIIRKPGVTTLQAMEREFAEIRSEAAKMQFPQLLEAVNSRLSAPMAFDSEFLSLQKVRNCLEHRGGRVGPRDVDDSGSLTLSFPRMRVFYLRGDTEVEMAIGEAVDTFDPANPFGTEEEVEIFMNRVTRSRTYALNEPVVISVSDFYEIAMACHMFAGDVSSKLPTLASHE